MESRLKRIEIGILVLLLFTIFNLVKPYISNKSPLDSEKQTNLPSLPADLTRDLIDKTVFKIKTNYNHSDWTEFYNVFGEYAKAQLSIEEIGQQFLKLKLAVGDIESYTYSHYVYEGNDKNAEWFEILYKCRFARGKGTIKVSTRTVDDASEVVGVNISINEL